jgi:hypothetical protein
VPRRIAAQLVGLLENRGGQPHVVGLTRGCTLFGDLGRALVKRRQCGGGAGAEAVPVVLGRGKQFAQAADVGQQPLGLGGRLGGHHAVEAVSGAHDGQRLSAGGGASGLVQGFAQQAFPGFGLAFDELLDLRAEAHREALRFAQVGDTAGRERVEYSQRDPPVGACSGCAAGRLDHRNRDLHLGDTLGIVLDPFQQAALEAQSRRLEAGREGFGCQRGRVLLTFRRPLGEVGEEQFGRPRRRLATRDGHDAVGTEKLQRLVGVAGHQVVEITAQGGESGLSRCDRGVDIGCRIVAQCRQELFYCIGEFRDAVEADDGQGAMRLVHAGTSLLQVVAGRIGGMCGEREPGTFQRKVDFPLDPGQRTDV